MQAATAEALREAIARNRPPVVHLIRFPRVSINHAVLVFDYAESDAQTTFSIYDPNAPEQPVPLYYDKPARSFVLPRNGYFRGGRVDVYEIYHRPWY
jgi:hypothetical protein